MPDDSNSLEAHLSTLTDLEPDELLAMVAKGVGVAEPIVGQFAKLCADIARERRLEVEAELAARLRELAMYFDKLDELRSQEVAARDMQYEALMVLLEVAKGVGDHRLIAEGMRCFQEFVKSSPALTRDFVEAVRAFDYSMK
jgi:hypothetical protein